jgi:adenylate kinase family enzyme
MLAADYSERVTHREHLVWVARLEEPSPEEWLLMRIAQRVQQVLSGKDHDKIKLKHQEVYQTEKNEFLKKQTGKPKYDPVAATKQAKAAWGARLGK